MAMEISLKNFKIWKDKNLNISTKGVILLSGKSGRGKSSILDSIAFCLYDMGRNLKTYGQKDLCVSITFDNFTIKRKKNPNLLQVFLKENGEEKVYENDLAQQFIKNTFGDFFKEIGYISQNSFNTFIYLNPSDKLEFIEKVIFKEENIQNIKDKCKFELKQLNNSLTSVSSNITYLSELLSTNPKPTPVPFPLKKIKSISEKEIVDNLYVKKKNTEIIERKSASKLVDIEAKIKDNIMYNKNKEVLEFKMLGKTNEITDIEKQLHNLESKVDMSKEDEIKHIISSYKTFKEYTKLNEKLADLKLKYEEIIYTENKQNEEKLHILESKLNKTEDGEDCEYTLSEAESSVSDLKKYLTDMEKFESLNKDKEVIIKTTEPFVKKYNYSNIQDCCVGVINEIERYKLELEMKEKELKDLNLYVNVIKCPHCSGGLRIKDDKLVKDNLKDGLTSENISSNIQKLKVEIKDISERLTDLVKIQLRVSKSSEKIKEIDYAIDKIQSSYEEIRESVSIRDDIDYLTSYIVANKQISKEIREIKRVIEGKIESKIAMSYKYQIAELENDINKLGKVSEIEITEEQYLSANTLFQNLNENKNKIKELLQKIDKNKFDLDKLKEGLNILNKNKPTEGLVWLENKKIEIEQIRKENYEKNKKIIDKISEVEKYMFYLKEKEKYDKFISDLNLMKKKESYIKEDIKNLNILRDKIIEAETMTITNFINTLSVHVNTYLERFFKEEPVFINIQTSKVTNTVKHGIHITIESKGNECNLEHLSGGERDRVSLAFTLALSEMFNNKILLLDECISSLDHETSSHVINGLKDNYKNNLVIVVAHQVNEGLFDDIIRV